jgi:G patch domain-containing protein 1
MTIGMRLLNKMGWKEGQGIGPRITRDAGVKLYGCARAPTQEITDDVATGDLSFAPRDVEAFHFTPKDDFKGIGYKGLDPSAALHKQSAKENKKLMGMSGQAFGIGALEDEDDDIYDTDHLSNYNRVVDSAMPGDSQFGWTGGQPGASDGSDTVNNLFRKAEKPLTAQKIFPPPLLPKDFKPYHQQQPSHLISSGSSYPGDSEKKLDARERGQILGESPIGGPSSVYGLLSGEDRKRLLATRDSVQEGRHPADFLQRRTPEQPELNQTEWQSRQITKERYEKTAKQFEQLAGAMASRFTSSHNLEKQSDETTEVKISETTVDTDTAAEAAKMKMFGLMTRQIIEWHPDRLVCKRFNVPDPYPKSSIVGIPKEKRKVSSLDQFISVDRLTGRGGEETQTSSSVERPSNDAPKLEFQRAIETQPVHVDKEKQSHSYDQSKNLSVEHKEDEKEEERPSMDIFKAIFADSEESESSEDEDKGNEEQHGNEQKEEAINININGTEYRKGLSSIPESTSTEKPPVDDNNRMEVSEDDESAMYGPSVPPPLPTSQIGQGEIPF